MAKVSIGLRGWRFEESAVFREDGALRPLDEMDPAVRERVSRLNRLVNGPCNACWVLYGNEDIKECNVASAVYGEPYAEILLCEEHEPDFLYWYREAGGVAHQGDPSLQDAFFEWFDGGGRAPDGYDSVEHVDTAPDELPKGQPADELEDPSTAAETDETEGATEASASDIDTALGDLDFEDQ